MEGEGSPVIDIMCDALKGPMLEALTASYSSDASSLGVTIDVAEAKAEVSVDPRELTRSYNFGASLVTVCCIR
jgi:hypothetical protein